MKYFSDNLGAMNFQQLRIIREAERCHFNLTEVAKVLYTSQSGISRHIRELEEELGVELFIRHGKRFLGLTEPGKEMLTIARRILNDADKAQRLAEHFTGQHQGVLTIATTHTQACYSLPRVIKVFREIYPGIRLVLNQGSPAEIMKMLLNGEADIGIASEMLTQNSNITAFPWFDWHHSLLVPAEHELVWNPDITLEQLATYPLVTYRYGIAGRSQIDKAFHNARLNPDIVLSAQDSDVVKTYVKLGLGIGIVAETASQHNLDPNLVTLKARHLFSPNTVWMAVKHGQLQRDYLWEFIQLCNPDLSLDKIKNSVIAGNKNIPTWLDFEI
ncbi:LysR family transcriptional regulator [Xenorhabdus stockiae]|uniref:LysR family transcriptional regulator n=2 Tax=Xenorhabdus stockiae TaxID=351614 RepID=A0A2D0KKH4_9GAMM|nr:LysR family transcriptional regulator [Xenorhabdus stockiae]